MAKMFAGQPLTDLVSEVTRATTVVTAATALINGIGSRVSSAVAQALANGASADELAPLTDLAAQVKQETDDLSAAVAANTPAAP